MNEPVDPPRLSERPSSKLGGLLREAKQDLPQQSELAALSIRLGATLGAGAVVVTLTRGTGLLAKLSAGAALSAAAVGLWIVHAHQSGGSAPEASAQHAAPSKPPVAATPAPLPAPAVSDTPEPAASEPTTAPAAPAPVAPSKPLLAVDEASLLERARGALSSNPAQALAIANEHLARYPSGVLSQEREVIAISALRKLGRTAEADRRAAAFAAHYPSSAYKRAVTGDSP